MFRALLAIGLALAAGPAAAASCLTANTPDQRVVGRLSQGTFEDAAGRKEKGFILTLAAPTCLTGPDADFDQVEDAGRIQIWSTDEAVLKTISRLVGKTVEVHGDPFGAHTAHHHAPIVMNVSRIEAR